jgi:hypothetical protein
VIIIIVFSLVFDFVARIDAIDPDMAWAAFLKDQSMQPSLRVAPDDESGRNPAGGFDLDGFVLEWMW